MINANQSVSSMEALENKNLIQYWDNESVPEEILELTNTWKDKNSDFNYQLFSKPEAIEYIERVYGSFTAALFKSARFPAMQADVFRVAFLLNEGGFYADAASRCKSNIMPLVEQSNGFLLMRRLKGTVCNGFIYSEKHNRILFKIWENIVHNMFMKDSNNIWKTSGPGTYVEPIKTAEKSDYIIVEQALMREKYFQLVGGLSHKGDSHWFKIQKTESIFDVSSDIEKVA